MTTRLTQVNGTVLWSISFEQESMTQHPHDERMRVFRRERAATFRGRGHGHVAPVRSTAYAELMFEHDLGARVVAVTVGDLLERRREERRVVRVAEHAMLLIDQCARLGLGERSRGEQQQRCTNRCECDVPRADRDDIASRANAVGMASEHD